MQLIEAIRGDLFLCICPSCHRNFVTGHHRRNCASAKAAKLYIAQLFQKESRVSERTIIERSTGHEMRLPNEERKLAKPARARRVKDKRSSTGEVLNGLSHE